MLKRSIQYILLALSMAVPLSADETMTFMLVARGVSLSVENGCQRIALDQGVYRPAPGVPLVPELPRQVLLPPGCEAAGIEIIAAVPETIKLGAPVQPCPRIGTVGDQSPIPSVAPLDSAIYASGDPYPGALARITGQGRMGPYRLVSLSIAPLQYIPARNILLRYHTVTVKVITRSTGHTTPNMASSPILTQIAARLVVNPNALRYYQATAKAQRLPVPQRIAVMSEDDPYDYLIITSERLQRAFAPLAQWKTRKGVPARVRTVEWIEQHVPGADPAEQVRSFIAREQQRAGISWVLLAGDVGDVPHRVAAGYPSDLYYSDLTGDWNYNRNATWGELADSVDLYPDVIVGRLPVGDTIAAANIVAKILGYEQAPLADYQTKVLFIGGDLDNQTHTGDVKDSIAAQNVAPYAQLRVDKIYPATTTILNRTNVLAALNEGYNLVNFSDHADYYSMGTGSITGGGQLTLADAAGLANAGRPGILYTIGCYNCAFDKGCIGERFLSAAGGEAAVIGCSRDAWFITGQPYASTSYLFDRGFFAALLSDSCYHLGAALALAKARLAPSSQDGLMRWSQYELNLLGDPELPVWTDSVRSITLQMPDSLIAGTDTFTIATSDSVTGLPLCGARICLWQAANGSYAVGTTDAAGAASFSCDPPDTGALSVTVTAHNYRSRTASLPVASAGQPHIAIIGQAISDSSGNGDGMANPGECCSLSLLIRNTGAAAADSVHILLTGSDPMIIPDTAMILLPNPLAGGDSVWCTAAPLITINQGCADNRRIKLSAVHLFPAGNTDSVNITIRADSLALEHFTLAEIAGNGNGRADSGETIELQQVRIGNYGAGRADSVLMTLVPAMPGITMLSDSLRIDSVPGYRAITAAGSFRFITSTAGPYRFELVISDRAGRQWVKDVGVSQRPAAPGTATAAVDRAGLRVGWDQSTGAAGYAVYRAPQDSSNYDEVSGLAIRNCLCFIDQQANGSSAYSYIVAAMDTSGCLSAPSAAATGSAAPGTAPGWPQPIAVYGGWNWNAPVAGDLDGDGAREVVMADPSGMVYVWDADGRSLPGWPRQFGSSIGWPAALADLDKDQRLELVIAYGETLAAVKADGTMLPGWPYLAGSQVIGPVICDLDRDGSLEIIVPCADNTMRALRWNGAVVTVGWTWTMPVGNTPKVSIGDVRGTSLPEIVVTSWAVAGSRSYVLDNQGNVLDSLLSSSSSDNNVPAPALLADLDRDYRNEIIVPYLTGSAICAWDSTGLLLWRAAAGMVWSTPAAFTAAGDSTLRIAAGAMDGNIVQLDHAGAAVAGWPVYWRAMHAAPMATDLSGDGSSELIVRGDYGMIQSLDDGRQTMPGFPITTDDGNYSPSTITRLAPGPGCDLLVDTRGCEVFRWRLSASPAQPPDWPMQGHDIFRSNRHGAMIDWCGRINRSLTISGDNIFDGDVVIDSGATMTVLPGSRLYFSDRRDFENQGIDPHRAELIVRGKLMINGQPDDSVYCDTWSNSPSDSSWHGIRIEAGGQANVNCCAILHSQRGLYYGVRSSPAPRTASGRFTLGQCKPNPAVAAVALDFQLPAAAPVTANVYNVAGQRVKQLADGLFGSGPHRVTWDGNNQNGIKAATGVYLIRVQAVDFSAVRKVTILR